MKKQAAPPENRQTIRRRILALLEGNPRTAKEISAAVRIPEREVGEHLLHLRKSLRAEGRRLETVPARCLGCGFVFRKRERPTGPGRCPVCRGEFISDPSFRVEIRSGGDYNGPVFRTFREPAQETGGNDDDHR